MATYQEQIEKARAVREAKKKQSWAALVNDIDQIHDSKVVISKETRYYGGTQETIQSRAMRLHEEWMKKRSGR